MRAAALVAALSVAVSGQIAGSIPAADAAKHAGKKRTVCGAVAGVRHPASGDAVLLDLVEAAPNQALTVTVARKVAGEFVADFEARAVRFDVCATGKIEGSKPRTIRVDKTDNIRGFNRAVPDDMTRDLSGIVPPRVTWEEKPRYTSEAMRARIQGSAEIQVRLGPDGKVVELGMRKSLDALYGLDEEALRAAAKWRFEPARRDGQPIPFTVAISLEFRLYPH